MVRPQPMADLPGETSQQTLHGLHHAQVMTVCVPLFGMVAMCAKGGGIWVLRTAPTLAMRTARQESKATRPTTSVPPPIVLPPPWPQTPGPDWSAQDLDALWTPNFWTQLRNLLRTLASFVPHPCFSLMEANPSHGGQPVAQQIEDGAHPVWQTHHIDIVQERKKQLTVL